MMETPPLMGINGGRSSAIANTPTDPAIYDAATSAAIRANPNPTSSDTIHAVKPALVEAIQELPATTRDHPGNAPLLHEEGNHEPLSHLGCRPAGRPGATWAVASRTAA